MITKRDALGRVVLGAPRSDWKQGVVDIMKAADEYAQEVGDSRELAGHVGACQALEGRPANAGGDGKYHPCGDGWYCPDAPTGGQDDD